MRWRTGLRFPCASVHLQNVNQDLYARPVGASMLFGEFPVHKGTAVRRRCPLPTRLLEWPAKAEFMTGSVICLRANPVYFRGLMAPRPLPAGQIRHAAGWPGRFNRR